MQPSLLLECREQIQNEITYYAELIHAEFDVLDENTVRVAGTGRFRSILYENELHDYSALEEAKRGRKPVYIPDRNNPVCRSCRTRTICTCLSEIVWPMYLNERFLGLVCALFYNPDAAERMQSDRNWFDTLFRHLTGMVRGLAESCLYRYYAASYETLTTGLINDMALPAVLLENRRIREYNEAARDYFRSSGKLEMQEGESLSVFSSGKNNSDLMLRSGNETLSLPAYYKSSMPDMPFKSRLETLVVKNRLINTAPFVSDTASRINLDYFEGTSENFLEFKEKVLKTYETSRYFYLEGERGLGKESWIRGIHESSIFSDQELVILDSSGLYDHAVFDSLFNEESGAFSRRNITLCLKEISLLAPWFQRKLADSSDLMQEHNIRLTVTSTEPAEALLKNNVISHRFYMLFYPAFMRVPPLRERAKDVDYYLMGCLTRFRDFAGRTIRLRPRARQQLLSYSWPGNFKQMEQIMGYLMTTCKNDTITEEDLGQLTEFSREEQSLNLQENEKKLITEALQKNSGPNGKAAAAKTLGISKATLYRKIKAYGLE